MKKHWKVVAPLALLALSSANTLAAECVIDRFNLADPALSWDNRDSIGDLKASRFKAERCHVPQGSTIKNVKLGFGYYTNPNILTNGLIRGSYGLMLSAGGIQASTNDAVVTGMRPRSIESSTNLSAFNGMDLHGLHFSLYSKATDYSVDLECNNIQPNVCEDFMSAAYKITVQYEALPHIPTQPSAPKAKLTELHNIALNWPSVTEADYYEVDVKRNNNSWTSAGRYISYSTTMHWQELGVGDRAYRIRACNSTGCSPNSNVSNIATIN